MDGWQTFKEKIWGLLKKAKEDPEETEFDLWAQSRHLLLEMDLDNDLTGL